MHVGGPFPSVSSEVLPLVLTLTFMIDLNLRLVPRTARTTRTY